jgi:hypothetical protein
VQIKEEMMDNKLKIFVFVLIILIQAHFVCADTVILADGRKLNGKFIKGDEKQIVFISEGITMELPRNLVSSISFGEKEVSVDARKQSASNGKIKGVITYYFNKYQGYKPDLGAVVYACKTKVDIGKVKDIDNEKEIDDFIRTFFKYYNARVNRELMALNSSYAAECQQRLKKLGADTEAGWKKLENEGWKVLWDLEANKIPSKKAIVGGDGTYSIELPPGNYFVIIKSKNRDPKDTFKTTKIAEGETVDISEEFFL